MAFSQSRPLGAPGPPSLRRYATCVLHVNIAVRHAREAHFVCEKWHEPEGITMPQRCSGASTETTVVGGV
jgi:hypothetical protein